MLATSVGQAYDPVTDGGKLQVVVPMDVHGMVSSTTGGGLGYAPGNTGWVLGGSVDAQYQVLTVGTGGKVLTYGLVYPGTSYSTGVAETERGGETPGAGAGLTIDVSALKPGGYGYAPGDTGTISNGTGGTYTVLTVDAFGAVVTFSFFGGTAGYTTATDGATVATTGYGSGFQVDYTAVAGVITVCALAATPTNAPIKTSALQSNAGTIAISGTLNSNVIPSGGLAVIGVGAKMSQAGTLSVQRYLDAGAVITQGTAVTGALTAATYAVANVGDDAKPFQSFIVSIINGGTVSVVDNVLILQQAGAA